MQAILEMSRYEYYKDLGMGDPPKELAYLSTHEMNARLSALESEINGIDEQIDDLKALRQTLLQEKEDIIRKNNTISDAQSDGHATVAGKGKAKASAAIDYTIEFDWDPQLKRTMKDVFGMSRFRLCQQG